MPKRRPADDLPMIVGFIVVRWRPAGAPAVIAGPPADRRRNIGRKFCHLLSKSGGHRTVARRWPSDMVQGRENPTMIWRSQKVGIGEKSTGHRRIYNPCDVAFNCILELKIMLKIKIVLSK